jgi:hypothetical protein
MAKLNVPFQFNCSVTTRKKIRENPDEAEPVNGMRPSRLRN